MERDTHFILGVYEDEDVLLHAVKEVRSTGVKIHEVYSPYPVHGLEHVLGYKRSRLPIAAFLFGMLGTSLALTMQFYMMKFDWPMIIGGKDFAAFPDFIPVSFERVFKTSISLGNNVDAKSILAGFRLVRIEQVIASKMAKDRSYKEVLIASNPVRVAMAH